MGELHSMCALAQPPTLEHMQAHASKPAQAQSRVIAQPRMRVLAHVQLVSTRRRMMQILARKPQELAARILPPAPPVNDSRSILFMLQSGSAGANYGVEKRLTALTL